MCNFDIVNTYVLRGQMVHTYAYAQHKDDVRI